MSKPWIVLSIGLAFCLLAIVSHAQEIASTDAAEVCGRATDGLSYSREHRTFHGARPGFERDHIVPLCLGGADTEKNLQWQPIDEARIKDRAETAACRAVCRYGTARLPDAQAWFMTDPTGALAAAHLGLAPRDHHFGVTTPEGVTIMRGQ